MIAAAPRTRSAKLYRRARHHAKLHTHYYQLAIGCARAFDVEHYGRVAAHEADVARRARSNADAAKRREDELRAANVRRGK